MASILRMFRNIQNLRRRNSFLLGSIILITACICISCSGGEQPTDDNIIIACGNDTAGILVKEAVASCTSAEQADIDAQQVGDCCGSNAQFALSTGDVDVAVVCPDAIQFLPEGGKDYLVAGTVVYDANLVVRKEGAQGEPGSIGYMNNRVNQIDLLRDKYGDGPELKQMYASGLCYALETDAVDAVVLDAVTALALEYPFEKLSDGQASSVMVIRKDLADDERFLDFVKHYNEVIDSLTDSDELEALLDTYLEEEDVRPGKEVLPVWQEMGVKFGKIEI